MSPVDIYLPQCAARGDFPPGQTGSLELQRTVALCWKV